MIPFLDRYIGEHPLIPIDGHGNSRGNTSVAIGIHRGNSFHLRGSHCGLSESPLNTGAGHHDRCSGTTPEPGYPEHRSKEDRVV